MTLLDDNLDWIQFSSRRTGWDLAVLSASQTPLEGVSCLCDDENPTSILKTFSKITELYEALVAFPPTE